MECQWVEKGAVNRRIKIPFVSVKQKYDCRFSEMANESCMAPTVKLGGSLMLMQECFGEIWPGNLIQIRSIMWKEEYHNILESHSTPLDWD